MRLISSLIVLLLCLSAESFQDFKCLKKCQSAKKKGVNCFKKCELNNKKVFQKKPTSKKAKILKKKLIAKHNKPMSQKEREEELLKAEVKADEAEQRRLEAEMQAEDREIEHERAQESKERHSVENADRKLAEELHKVAEERAKLIKVEHAEAKAKLKEELDEHGMRLMHRTGVAAKAHHKFSPKKDYACMRGCLLAIHNVPVCRQRCAKKMAQKKKKSKLTKAQRTKALQAKKRKEKAMLRKGCGPCYGAKPKGKCCNTCGAVKAAYAAKHWALPPLKRMVQCHKQAQQAKQAPHAHSRIFRSNTGREQHKTNKVIHKLLFKKMQRHTVAKGHFKPKMWHPKILSHAKQEQIRKNVAKWKKYHQKRWKGKHVMVSPTFFKKMSKAKMVKSNAPVLHQQGMMLGMNAANLRKWQMLKIHNWATPHKGVLKVKVKQAKKATLKYANKHPKVVKKKKAKHPKTKKHF